MTGFVDQLRLAERAKEDIYFARIDRELIDAMHQHKQFDRLTRPRNNQGLAQPDTSTEQSAVRGPARGCDT